MTIQKVENSPLGNRTLMIAIITDLVQNFGYKGYKASDTLSVIQRKEGSMDVINYMQRKYKL